ncbi:hypothetical protein TEA_026634 [Camellia sinensis var. sinensis]|uniref:Disease resistance N-terminal domain-containing protein n=1 Tax=Camellia sinensis var. sinensis TaxID=542762 RepID=A0A4S4EVM3_CAMSN|nr:hypothetical protein TEA_026634 [Camellia sinensis var. sinensis]
MASSSRPATQNMASSSRGLLTLFPELNESTREITGAVASEPQPNTSGFAPLNFPMRSVEQKMAVQTDIEANQYTLKSTCTFSQPSINASLDGSLQPMKTETQHGQQYVSTDLSSPPSNKGEEVSAVAYTDLLQPKEISAVSCSCANLSSETDYVDDAITEYLTFVNPNSCCEKLENLLIHGLLDGQGLCFPSSSIITSLHTLQGKEKKNMAEALVGGAFLSATLQVLLDRLASPVVINFFRGKKHGDRVPLLHKKLKLSLLGLKAVLNDAENKQITNPAVKEWVEELKDVIYHADDIVDEIATEALRSKSEADYQSSSSTSSHSRLSQVLSLIPLTLTSSVSTTASLFDAGIESRLEKIIHDLEYFAQKKDVLEFSGLKELRVTNCPKLIGGLPKHIPSWVRVEIGDCPGLMASLPRTCAANQLVLWGCDSVELGWQGLSSLVNLEISSASLKELTPELYTLINLKELMIVQCPDLLLFPDTRLPPMLTGLTIIDCRAICFLPERVMRLNSCLKRLSVRACPKLVFPLSEEMENCYTSLEYLSLETCDSLPSLPLELFPKLQSLRIKDCRNFETLLTLNRLGFQNSASLEWLCLDGCSNMESFSQQVLIAPNLKTFYLLNCKKLKSLPDRMHSLTSLQSLRIWNCPGLEEEGQDWHKIARIPLLHTDSELSFDQRNSR